MSDSWPEAYTFVKPNLSPDPCELRSEIIRIMIGHGALQEFAKIDQLLNWASQLENYILNGKQGDKNAT